MDKLSPEEIQQIARVAGIVAPGLTEEALSKLLESVQSVKEPGFVDTLWELRPLRQKWNIPLDQIPGRLEQAMARIQRLQAEIEALQRQKASHASEAHKEEERLSQVRKEWAREEAALESFRREAELETERLHGRVDRARKKARLAEDEIARFRELKAELDACRLSPELVLKVAQEIPNDEETTGFIAALIEQAGSLKAGVAALREEHRAASEENQRLRQDTEVLHKRHQELETTFSRMKGDFARQKQVYEFYDRYGAGKGLLDYVARWENRFLRHCSYCGARFILERRAHSQRVHKPYDICPCCSFYPASYDSEAHRILGLPPDARFWFNL